VPPSLPQDKTKFRRTVAYKRQSRDSQVDLKKNWCKIEKKAISNFRNKTKFKLKKSKSTKIKLLYYHYQCHC